jgi:hypothetical protein
MMMGNLTCRTFSTSSSSHTHGTTSIITLCDSRRKHNVVSTLVLMPKAWRRIIVWTGGSSARRLQLQTKHTHTKHTQLAEAELHSSEVGPLSYTLCWSLNNISTILHHVELGQLQIPSVMESSKSFSVCPLYPVWHLFFYEAKWQI